MDKASVHGAGSCKFDSCRAHCGCVVDFFYVLLDTSLAPLAQLVEHLTVEPYSNQMVPGLIPGGRISRANAQRPPHGGNKPATHLHNIPPPGLEPGSLG